MSGEKGRVCLIEWCNNPHKANGFCSPHYRRNKRGTDMNKPFRIVVRPKMAMKDRLHGGDGEGAYKDGCRCDLCCKAALGKAKARREAIYKVIARIKLERGCMDCGYNQYSCALEFDHRPNEVKKFTIGSAAGSKSLKNILQEIEKCDVVCGNCHQVRSQRRIGGFILTLEDLKNG